MLQGQTVTVGKFYVNNQRKVARAVVRVDLETVRFHTYHLDTGNSCGSPSECTRQDFIHWADREASHAEIASLQSKGMDARFRAPQTPYLEELEHDMAIDLERVTPESG